MNNSDTKNRFAYIRVSDKKQHVERQIAAIQQYTGGLPASNCFMDKESGRIFERAEYLRLKSIVQPGDEVVVAELDRVGRSYDQLKQEWAWFERHGVHVTMLDDPQTLPENQRADMRPTEKALRDCSRTLRSAHAEEEWIMRKHRQTGGIEQAKARGVYTGANHKGRRRRQVDPAAFERLYAEYQSNPISLKTVADELGVSVSKVSRMFNERKRHGAQYHPNKLSGLYDTPGVQK